MLLRPDSGTSFSTLCLIIIGATAAATIAATTTSSFCFYSLAPAASLLPCSLISVRRLDIAALHPFNKPMTKALQLIQSLIRAQLDMAMTLSATYHIGSMESDYMSQSQVNVHVNKANIISNITYTQ